MQILACFIDAFASQTLLEASGFVDGHISPIITKSTPPWSTSSTVDGLNAGCRCETCPPDSGVFFRPLHRLKDQSSRSVLASGQFLQSFVAAKTMWINGVRGLRFSGSDLPACLNRDSLCTDLSTLYLAGVDCGK